MCANVVVNGKRYLVDHENNIASCPLPSEGSSFLARMFKIRRYKKNG